MNEQKLQLTKDIKIVNEETYLLQDYLALMMESLQNVDFNHDIIDIQEE